MGTSSPSSLNTDPGAGLPGALPFNWMTDPVDFRVQCYSGPFGSADRREKYRERGISFYPGSGEMRPACGISGRTQPFNDHVNRRRGNGKRPGKEMVVVVAGERQFLPAGKKKFFEIFLCTRAHCLASCSCICTRISSVNSFPRYSGPIGWSGFLQQGQVAVAGIIPGRSSR